MNEVLDDCATKDVIEDYDIKFAKVSTDFLILSVMMYKTVLCEKLETEQIPLNNNDDSNLRATEAKISNLDFL